MGLDGWDCLNMVLRYTRSVKFEDRLRLYRRFVEEQLLKRDLGVQFKHGWWVLY